MKKLIVISGIFIIFELLSISTSNGVISETKIQGRHTVESTAVIFGHRLDVDSSDLPLLFHSIYTSKMISKEAKRVYDRNYRLINKDRLKSVKKTWRIKNREKINAWKLKWTKSENGKASAKKYRDKNSSSYMRLYIQSAKRRNIEFDLNIDEFDALIHSDCAYCGSPAIIKRNGVDRIDNNRGYVNGNVIACCKKCNQMKGTLTKYEFFSHLTKILEYGIECI